MTKREFFEDILKIWTAGSVALVSLLVKDTIVRDVVGVVVICNLLTLDSLISLIYRERD
jgi:hypothetical protein